MSSGKIKNNIWITKILSIVSTAGLMLPKRADSTTLGSVSEVTARPFTKVIIAACLGFLVFTLLPINSVSAQDVTPTQTAQESTGSAEFASVDYSQLFAPATPADNAALSGWKLNVYQMIVNFGSLFAWFGGYMLDISISVFVANMAATSEYFGMKTIVSQLWEIVRDFFNLLFIFSLIFIGFKIILGDNDSSTKRTLGTIIIAALLINFSLYFSQLIIDISNVTAHQIQKLLNVNEYQDSFVGVKVGKISDAFVAQTNIEKWSEKGQTNITTILGNNTNSGAWQPFVLGFITMFALIIMGFVFAAGAIILLTRFVVLIFMMIASPAMFLFLLLPQFREPGKKWWSLFINQALVGPVYLFMLYISYKVLSGLSEMQEYTLINILMLYIIVIAFLCLSLVASKRLGAFGATQAISMGQGGAKWLRANTMGRAATAAGLTYSSISGGLAKRRLDKIDEYENRTGKRVWFSKTRRGNLEAKMTSKTLGSSSYKERSDYADKRDKEIARSTQTRAINTAITAAETALKTPAATRTQAQKDSIIAMEQKLAGATKDQITDMAKSPATSPSLVTIAGPMKQEHFDAIINDKEVGDDFKNKMKTARTNSITAKLGLNTTTTRGLAGVANIKEATKDQLKALDYQTIMDGARFLQDSQVKELDGAFTPYQVELIKEKRNTDIKNIKDPAEADQIIDTRKGESEIAKLPSGFLEGAAFAGSLVRRNKLTVSLLKKIATDSDANKPNIRTKILAAYTAAGRTAPQNITDYFNSDDGRVFQ